jgi:hypothetical protein
MSGLSQHGAALVLPAAAATGRELDDHARAMFGDSFADLRE